MSVGVETRSRLTGCAEFSSAEGIVEALVGVGGGCWFGVVGWVGCFWGGGCFGLDNF